MHFIPCFRYGASRAALDGPPAATFPLDGVSGVTGAWSAGRKLLSAYAGDLYTLTLSRVSTLHDQSGNARDFTQGTAGNRPVILAAGPNSKDSLDFTSASDHFMSTAATLADFVNADAAYIVVSFIADAFTANTTTPALNDVVLCDDGLFAGVTVRNTGGGLVYSYNWDGTYDAGSTTITTATAYVVELRHTGGSIFNRVNAGTESSALSGNTTSLTGVMRLGGDGTSLSFDGKIFELAMFDAVPDETTRNTLVADLMSWAGAS